MFGESRMKRRRSSLSLSLTLSHSHTWLWFLSPALKIRRSPEPTSSALILLIPFDCGSSVWRPPLREREREREREAFWRLPMNGQCAAESWWAERKWACFRTTLSSFFLSVFLSRSLALFGHRSLSLPFTLKSLPGRWCSRRGWSSWGRKSFNWEWELGWRSWRVRKHWWGWRCWSARRDEWGWGWLIRANGIEKLLRRRLKLLRMRI